MSNKKTANRIPFSGLLTVVLDTVFPNRCLFCGVTLHKTTCLCADCLDTLEYIHTPFCERCGAPVDSKDPTEDHDVAAGNGCPQCRGVSFSFRKNLSIGLFTGGMRKLIHAFKFEDRRSLGKLFARLALSPESGHQEYIAAHDVIVPVPLSPLRYDKRGYNQSLLIARELARLVHTDCRKNAIVRRGRSVPQSSIDHLQHRLDNMKDRFTVRRSEAYNIENRNILLIDDVLTSGATASACARGLLDAGACTVDLFTLARAVKHIQPGEHVVVQEKG